MKTKFLILFIVFTTFCKAQVVTIPDVNFKNALLNSLCVDADLNGSYESDADLNNNGEIEVSEAILVQRLNISGKNIADLTGIQSFTNLKKIICFNNILTSVNFSSNLSLQEISCYNNSFVSLTINGLPLLSTLSVYPNVSLQNLTVTNNPNLTTLTLLNFMGSLSNLTTLNCSSNALTSLNLYSNNYPLSNLTNVNCSNNQLTNIPLNSSLNILNISNNLLSNFTLSHQNIVDLDISNNNLTQLSLYNCYNLSNLNLLNNPNLNSLGLNNTNLVSLSIHDFNNLQYLDCSFQSSNSGTKLTSLQVYNLPALISLTCDGNNIGNLIVADFPNLTTINHYDNNNINLTLSNLPLLVNYTAFGGNSITVSNMSNLTDLTFSTTFSTSFDNIFILNNPQLNTVNYNQQFINQFVITNAPSLTNLNFSTGQTTPFNLNITSLPSLTNLDLNINDNCTLNLSNLPLLYYINIEGITNFNFHDLPQLHKIESQNGILTNFSLLNLPNLYELKLNYNDLVSINLNNLPNLYTVDVSDNNISSISLTNLPLIHDMNFGYNYSGQVNDTYDFSNLPNLYDLNLNHTSVKNILLNNLPNLHDFLVNSNSNVTSLNFSNLPNLYNLEIVQCSKLNSILFNNLNSIYKIKIYSTLIQGINISNLPNLYDLEISSHSNIPNNAFVLNNLPSLFKLNLSTNNLSTFNFAPLPSLNELNISVNSLSSLNLNNLSSLTNLNISENSFFLTELDLSSNPNISVINYSNGYYYDKLKYINLKNGGNNMTSLKVGTSVKNICVDDQSEKTLVQSLDTSLANTIFTTYCSFNPTGTYYTLQGNNLLDFNTNGCDVNDITFPMINLNIETGGITNSYFADNTGNYLLAISAGQYTITPTFENANYYTFSPASLSLNFPTQASPFIQNFCITPNGNHNDLEVILLPLVPARPGFDAVYKIVYKNKGNQIQSGTINLNFDDTLMDFVTSSQTASNQSTNLLSWTFNNLSPFEKREITVTLNINSPTENPSVISGTILNYSSEIIGLTDENPNDNISTLNQTVVNAFDPNDKTCIEGQNVTNSVIGNYVHYFIRFQNTGNAIAQNVIIKDIIDLTKFDISTLTPIDGSHNFYTRIKETNHVEFIFENINLPFISGSNNGYIAFKIKTKPTLVEGNSFSNQVNIYFDYNNPIVTNNFTSTIQNSLTYNLFETENFSVYPNPVKDILYFKTDENISKIEFFDISGRIISSKPVFENRIDLSELKTGNYILKIYTNNGMINSKIIKE